MKFKTDPGVLLPKSARAIALEEIQEEDFDATVVAEKERIRRHVPLWHRIFPFVISINRRENP
jgi:hypothetical protein